VKVRPHRFKRVLADYPEEHERWFEWKMAAFTRWIREWLNGLGIEPVQRGS